MKALIGAIAASAIGEAHATGYAWKDHAAPYDFLFGNEIDTHQQTRLASDHSLAGFLYVHYTGERTSDGLAIAGEPQSGYLLELRAVARFCFVHHDAGPAGDGSCRARGGVAVVPGLDIATHVNIVTTAP